MAAGGLIGALRVDLSLDSAKFEAGTKRARSIAQRDAAAIHKSLSGIKGSLNGLIAGATITAFTAATKRALDYAGGLGEVSQQLGVTSRDLQVYRYIASQVGVEQDTMDSSLAKLTRTMGQAADGSKAQANAFRDLGVAIQDSNGKLYTAGEILPRLADAFARIKDPATRARLEAELFGRAGQKLDPLLTQGAKGVEVLTKRAEELGLVLGDDLIKSADDASDKLAEMQKQLEVGFARAVAESAGAIVGLANAFATLTSQVINFINRNPQLTGALAGIAAGARFGLPGAAIGGAAGLVLGDKYAQARDAGNMDPQFRAKALKNAIAKWRGAKGTATPGANMSTMGMSGGISSGPGSDSAAWQEVERQWALFNQSKAPGTGGSAPIGAPGALPTASGGGSKKKGPKDKTQEYRERYDREMMGLMDDELQFQSELTTDIQTRADLEQRRVAATTTAAMFEIDAKESAGELSKEQAERQRLLTMSNARLEQQVIDQKLADDLSAEVLEISNARREAQIELLQGERASARTAAERRRIELEILEHQKAIEAAQIAKILADNQSTAAAKEEARLRQESLSARYDSAAGAIRRDTMGPMAAWMDSLPRTADELREKFESIKVDALNNGLDIASRNVLKLKGFAGDLFNQLIADVIRLNLQSALAGGSGLLGGLGKLLGMANTSGIISEAGATGGLAMTHAGAGNIKGLATGGSFMAGGIPGTDRNVLAINGIPRVRVSANENVTIEPLNKSGAKSIVQLVVGPGQFFEPSVTAISGGVSVQTVTRAGRGAARSQRQQL